MEFGLMRATNRRWVAPWPPAAVPCLCCRWSCLSGSHALMRWLACPTLTVCERCRLRDKGVCIETDNQVLLTEVTVGSADPTVTLRSRSSCWSVSVPAVSVLLSCQLL